MLAIVAPGQGAQTPGFLAPWVAEPTIADHLNWLGAAAALDLVHYGSGADAETIRDTAVAQPLLVAAGLIAAAALSSTGTNAFDSADVVAGHSVGELTAAAGTGVISEETAMVLVRERGKAMAMASAATPTSMTAVVGGDRDEVLSALEAHGLTAANNNGSGQIAAAGTLEQLASLAAHPPRRTRLFPLSVAGAFHTHHMHPAVAHLESLIRAITADAPRSALLGNGDGTVVTDGSEFLTRIVRQVANPVRWDLCMETMADMGVTGLLELPPSGTLTGIAKRNLKGVELFSLNTPDQLDDARTFCGNHADSAPVHPEPGTSTFHRDQENV